MATFSSVHDITDHTGIPGVGGGASTELAYVEFTSAVSVTATVEDSADTVVSAGAVVFDGSTAVWIEFFAPFAIPDSASILLINLFDGSTDIGRLLQLDTNAASQRMLGVFGRRRLTPSAASHTYSVRAWEGSGAASATSIEAGTGGDSLVMPGYIRITTA